ncbi:uncharacterized protein LOC133629258 [Colius striatus]|uniref:uncharacterized protein LOC133629258 n=1 Tax=Colius striatus TaxID=57412 RepID=UPI002B1E3601|nr:uncharacterized protein LOC133629258 [Colius striatus]
MMLRGGSGTGSTGSHGTGAASPRPPRGLHFPSAPAPRCRAKPPAAAAVPAGSRSPSVPRAEPAPPPALPGVSQRGGGAGGCSRGSRRRRLRPCGARRRRPSSPRLSAGRRAGAGWGLVAGGALWAVVEAASAGASVLCLCEKGDAKVTEETGKISKKEKEMKTGAGSLLLFRGWCFSQSLRQLIFRMLQEICSLLAVPPRLPAARGLRGLGCVLQERPSGEPAQHLSPLLGPAAPAHGSGIQLHSVSLPVLLTVACTENIEHVASWASAAHRAELSAPWLAPGAPLVLQMGRGGHRRWGLCGSRACWAGRADTAWSRH